MKKNFYFLSKKKNAGLVKLSGLMAYLVILLSLISVYNTYLFAFGVDIINEEKSILRKLEKEDGLLPQPKPKKSKNRHNNHMIYNNNYTNYVGTKNLLFINNRFKIAPIKERYSF